jgi:hypothetical protein
MICCVSGRIGCVTTATMVVKGSHKGLSCLAKHLHLLLLRIKLVMTFLGRLGIWWLNQTISVAALSKEVPWWELLLHLP